MAYCVGLTGGIGTGKSEVSGLFGKLGAAVVDTDEISHALDLRQVICCAGDEAVHRSAECKPRECR